MLDRASALRERQIRVMISTVLTGKKFLIELLVARIMWIAVGL